MYTIYNNNSDADEETEEFIAFIVVSVVGKEAEGHDPTCKHESRVPYLHPLKTKVHRCLTKTVIFWSQISQICDTVHKRPFEYKV